VVTKTAWIGRKLSGRYEILELLGQGGMSAVFKAQDHNLKRIVAIKLIHAHLSNDPEFVWRFEQEAAAVAQLRHPNLIQVFDFNHDPVVDTYYIVFEFVPGETLQDRLKRLSQAGHRMEIKEVVEIVAKTADALHYAHNKEIIHRDIKPANIMLNVYGEPIVTDFGIAKIMGGMHHTATGATLGTACYMAPEQIKGEYIDPRTDIYALGIVLYEMLSGGQPPFEADSAMALMMKHITDPVPNLDELRPDLRPSLVAIVNKALAKDKNSRFASAAEMAVALRRLDEERLATAPAMADVTVIEPSLIGPDKTVVESMGAPTAVPAPKTTTRYPMLLGVGTLVVLLLVVTGWAIFIRPGDNPESIAVATAAVLTADGEATAIAAFETTAELTNTIPPSPTTGSTQTAVPAAVQEPGIPLTAAPSATLSPTPSSTPTVRATPTPEPIQAFAYLSLADIANGEMDFNSPPGGLITLKNIPFQIESGIFKSQASTPPHNTAPTHAILNTSLARAHRLYLLLNSGNGFVQFNGLLVGRLNVVCNETIYTVADLQLGREVREWHSANNVVSSASQAQQVWQGTIAGHANLIGYIDMLTVDLPHPCQNGDLTVVELIDTSAESVQSLDPALNLIAVTVEHYAQPTQ
jgi:hypothetical protein